MRTYNVAIQSGTQMYFYAVDAFSVVSAAIWGKKLINTRFEGNGRVISVTERA